MGKRIATCTVVAFEYIPQRAAACVGRGGEDQRTTGRLQAGLNGVQDLDVRVGVGRVHVPEGQLVGDDGPRSRFMQVPTDNDLAQSGAVLLSLESARPASVMFITCGPSFLGPSLKGDRDPLLAREPGPGRRRVNLDGQPVFGVHGVGFPRWFDGRHAGDQEC
jgi:hypothetical protein